MDHCKQPPQLEKLFQSDHILRDYEKDVLLRWGRFTALRDSLSAAEGGLAAFAAGYERHGLLQRENGDITLCEWAPNAARVSLAGEFNDWNDSSHFCTRDDFAKFHLTLPATREGRPAIAHGSEVKVVIHTRDGRKLWRMSPWTKYAVQRQETGMDYKALHWAPPQRYQWQHARPARPSSLRIYEGHVGICSPEAKIASYRYFADHMLPYIKSVGYTCVELMAVMEHAYYGSFGYHVTNFFAASSRYGTPDDFKYLVDTAHGLGLYVVLDVVHSHAAVNVNDGLNEFDGTDACFFHSGAKGQHALWDSKIFDYTKWEVLRFLLSNLRWYVEEYHVDGFRFDGVTSMLYLHRGVATGFTGGYHEYFNTSVDMDALVYLMLANHLLHSTYPEVITIAEDVSGMPTLCRPVSEGGIGFDYRMAMAIPDMWIKLLKEVKDDDWNMSHICWTLTNRRSNEPCIAYTECHDQALVGDKTLAFWMMDAEMYSNMSLLSARTVTIDRGLALHKMLRLITIGLGGEAYLNFIGNEFGHPEWLDFPRQGNDWSYHFARRQMNLASDKLLRYRYLQEFDKAMMAVEERFKFLSAGRAYVSRKHEGDKVVVFERGGLVWAFNFHTSQSYTGYRVATEHPGKYCVVLDTDSAQFDGHGRVASGSEHLSSPGEWDGRGHSLQVYLPCRTALLLARVD